MPKPGDVVIYSVGQREYVALVLLAHANEASHLGAEKEPLLHLVYVDPEVRLPVGNAGYRDFVRIEHDVVHQSHKFSANYIQLHGSYAGAGRWREEYENPPQATAELAPPENQNPEQPSDAPPQAPGSTPANSPLGT